MENAELPMTVAISIPSAKEFAQQGAAMIQKAKSIVVGTPEQYALCGEDLKLIATRVKTIGETLDPIISNAHKTHRQLTTLKNEALAPYEDAKRLIQGKMGAYKRAEEERAAAERRRLEEEERRRQEAAALEAAAQLEQQGDTKAADEVIQAAIEAPQPVITAPIATPNVPKVSGVSARKRFVFDIVESAKIPREYLMVNEPAIRAVVARIGRDAEKLIPGIAVREEESFAARAFQ